MDDKKFKPSAWEHPEFYEKAENLIEPQRERSPREFIEIRLSESGFAVDLSPGGDIIAWPRGTNSSAASYVIGQRGNTYVVKEAKGGFARAKVKKAMGSYLQGWIAQYNIGARS